MNNFNIRSNASEFTYEEHLNALLVICEAKGYTIKRILNMDEIGDTSKTCAKAEVYVGSGLLTRIAVDVHPKSFYNYSDGRMACEHFPDAWFPAASRILDKCNIFFRVSSVDNIGHDMLYMETSTHYLKKKSSSLSGCDCYDFEVGTVKDFWSDIEP